MTVDTEAQTTRTTRASIPGRVGVRPTDLLALARIQRNIERAMHEAEHERDAAREQSDYDAMNRAERARTLLDITRTNLLHARRMLSGLDIARTL